MFYCNPHWLWLFLMYFAIQFNVLVYYYKIYVKFFWVHFWRNGLFLLNMIAACNNNNKYKVYVPVYLSVIYHMHNVFQRQNFRSISRQYWLHLSFFHYFNICFRSVVNHSYHFYYHECFNFLSEIYVAGCRTSNVPIIWFNAISRRTWKTDIYIIVVVIYVWR